MDDSLQSPRGGHSTGYAPFATLVPADALGAPFSAAPPDPSLLSSSDSLDSSLDDDLTWVNWFVSLKGNHFFAEVDPDFLEDDFNLTGLSAHVAFYNYALDTILDVDIPDGELDDAQSDLVEASAEALYGLIHARFIVTARGLQLMLEKFNRALFGRCPRVLCKGQPVLPVGLSDLPRTSTVKVFCPKCWDIFTPREKKVCVLDGAYWGTTFPHLFLQTYSSLVPRRNSEAYVPRIFGFKIHKSADAVRRNLEGVQQESEGVSEEERRRNEKW